MKKVKNVELLKAVKVSQKYIAPMFLGLLLLGGCSFSVENTGIKSKKDYNFDVIIEEGPVKGKYNPVGMVTNKYPILDLHSDEKINSISYTLWVLNAERQLVEPPDGYEISVEFIEGLAKSSGPICRVATDWPGKDKKYKLNKKSKKIKISDFSHAKGSCYNYDIVVNIIDNSSGERTEIKIDPWLIIRN